jgi:hypothetical protein
MFEKIVQSYPQEIRNKIKILGLKESDNIPFHKIDSILKKSMGHMSFKVEQFCTKLQIINVKEVQTSPIMKICFPFKEGSNIWFENLCMEYGTKDFFVLTKNGSRSIKGMTRKELSKFDMIYGESDFQIKETPIYHSPDKSNQIYAVLNTLFSQLELNLIEKLSQMNSTTFSKFLNQDEIIYFIQTQTEELLNSENTFQDQSTISIEQFLERYLHMNQENLENRFYDYLDIILSIPLQCTLFFASKRFLIWIAEMHLQHHRIGEKTQMTSNEFKLFWKKIISEFFDYTKKRFHIKDFIKFMNGEDIFDIEMICKDIYKVLLSNYKYVEQSDEFDEYMTFYQHVEIPHYYKWIIKGTVVNADVLMSQLKKGSRLTLSGKRKSFKPKGDDMVVSFVRKTESHPKDGKNYEFHSKNHSLIVSKEENDTHPMIYIHDDSNQLDNICINPYTGEWSILKDKKIEKQKSRLKEIVDNKGFILMEE